MGVTTPLGRRLAFDVKTGVAIGNGFELLLGAWCSVLGARLSARKLVPLSCGVCELKALEMLTEDSFMRWMRLLEFVDVRFEVTE